MKGKEYHCLREFVTDENSLEDFESIFQRLEEKDYVVNIFSDYYVTKDLTREEEEEVVEMIMKAKREELNFSDTVTIEIGGEMYEDNKVIEVEEESLESVLP